MGISGYFSRCSGEHTGLIANAAGGMSVFGTVAQALVPAAPGLFPALGLVEMQVSDSNLICVYPREPSI